MDSEPTRTQQLINNVYEEFDFARRLQKALSVIVVAGFVVAVGGISAILVWTPQQISNVIDKELSKVTLKTDIFGEKVDELQRQVRALEDKAVSPRLEDAALQQLLERLNGRIEKLEVAIENDVDKALSVPLLRKDFETIRASLIRQEENSAKQIDRIYDQNKWFIGLMVTIALGLVGLAVSNFMQINKAVDAAALKAAAKEIKAAEAMHSKDGQVEATAK